MGIENKTARDLVFVKFIAISYHRTRSKKIPPKGTSNTRDLRILSLAVGLIAINRVHGFCWRVEPKNRRISAGQILNLA